MSPWGSDYIFTHFLSVRRIVSEDSRYLDCTWVFMLLARAAIVFNPSIVKCCFCSMRVMICEKSSKFFCLLVWRRWVSKNTMSFFKFSRPRTRTSNRSPWFRVTNPTPRVFRILCNITISRLCCTIRNSGRTCHPNVILGCLFIATWKHPSPSTNPAIHSASRLSCWLSALFTFLRYN